MGTLSYQQFVFPFRLTLMLVRESTVLSLLKRIILLRMSLNKEVKSRKKIVKILCVLVLDSYRG